MFQHNQSTIKNKVLTWSRDLTVTFFVGNIATNGLAFYWNYFCIYAPSVSDAYLMVARFVVGVFMSVTVLMVIQVALRLMPKLEVLARYGVETLGVYYVSGHMVVYGCNRFVDLEASSMELCLASLIVFLVSWGIVKLLKANFYVSLFVWGGSIRR